MRKDKSNQRGMGSATAVVISVIAAAVILGIAFIGVMRSESGITQKLENTLKAQYIAEAAIAEALVSLRRAISDGSATGYFTSAISSTSESVIPPYQPLAVKALVTDLCGEWSFSYKCDDVEFALKSMKPFTGASAVSAIEKWGVLCLTARARVGSATVTIEAGRDFKVVNLSPLPLPSGTQYGLFTSVGVQPKVDDVSTVDGNLEAKKVYEDEKYFPFYNDIVQFIQNSPKDITGQPQVDEAAMKTTIENKIKNQPDWQTLFSNPSATAVDFMADTRKISYFFTDKAEFDRYFKGSGDKRGPRGNVYIRTDPALDLGKIEFTAPVRIIADKSLSFKLDATNPSGKNLSIVYLKNNGTFQLKGDFKGSVLSPYTYVDADGGAKVNSGNVITKAPKGWEATGATKSSLEIKPDKNWMSAGQYCVTIGEQLTHWRFK